MQGLLSAITETADSLRNVGSEGAPLSKRSMMWSSEVDIDRTTLKELVGFEVISTVGREQGNQASVVRRLGLQVSAPAAVIETNGVPYPIQGFEMIPAPQPLLNNLMKLRMKHPTPIQRQLIPLVLLGQDCYAVSPTKSGKTAAYLIPLITQIWHLTSSLPIPTPTTQMGPYAVILVPTHEAAIQVESDAKSLAQGVPMLRTVLVIGSDPVPDQLHRLSKGCQLLVGTPGRVSSLLKVPQCPPVNCVSVVVLDGIERLKDSAMEKQVKDCFEVFRRKRTQIGDRETK
ncbi:DEAD (Asp-Glu-Ala-Asp) box polypeptide 59, partial [Dinochytrium kinnereticum]